MIKSLGINPEPAKNNRGIILKSLFDKWLGVVAKSDNTKRNYSQSIKAFCEFTDKDPDQLIIEAEKEIKEGLLMRERSVSDYVPDFIEFLRAKTLLLIPFVDI